MHTASHQRRSFNRLGAIGMTAALTVLGGGALLQKCGPPPPPPPPPPIGAPLAINAEMISLVNSYRAQVGVAPVTENWNLDMAAIDHSNDQAERMTMTHTGWNGSNAGQRMVENGYQPSTWGENVAYGQPTVAAVMTAWMNSSGHRANILNPAFVHIGVAAVTAANGAIYWTMDLAAPVT
jgi:uncharacterized protein YkwD